jgi:hypothetical protein
VFGGGGKTKVYATQPERQHAVKALGDLDLFLKDWCGCLRHLYFFSFWRQDLRIRCCACVLDSWEVKSGRSTSRKSLARKMG